MYLGNVIQSELSGQYNVKLFLSQEVTRGHEICSINVSRPTDVNPFVRLRDTFGELFFQLPPDDDFMDLLLHFYGALDLVHPTKETIIIKKITSILEELNYGKLQKLFKVGELSTILHYFLEMKKHREQFTYFNKVRRLIFPQSSIFFDTSEDKYILNVATVISSKNERWLKLLLDLFFDVSMEVSIYWGGEFSIIGYSRIEVTLIYSEEK